MPRLLSLSRAARLVGTTRGKLQKQVQDGEITSFEGKVRLSDLHSLYPQAQIENTVMLDRVEEIIERARFKARSRLPLPTDKQSLLARAANLADELALAKMDLSNYAIFIHKLKSKLKQLQDSSSPENREIFHQLTGWVEAELPKAVEHPPQNNPLLIQDTMLRLITAQIHIQPSGHEYLLEGNNTLLEAGLSAGFALNYGCSNGNCGKCKAKLLSGQIKKTRAHDYSFSESEKLQDYFLMCSNTALTDLIIEADEAGDSKDIPLQSITTKVRKLEKASDDVSILNLKTPRTNRLRFLAGQHVKLSVNDALGIQLPIASCPCDDMNIQFHIPSNTDHPFYQHINQQLKTNDDVKLEGPMGDFILDDDASNPLILLAQNTGFAPVKSLAEHAITLAHAESVSLCWYVTPGNSHYLRNQCRAWADAFDSLHYHEYTLSDGEQKEIDQQALLAALADISLADSHVYIAGDKHFIEQCEAFFNKHSVSRVMIEEIE